MRRRREIGVVHQRSHQPEEGSTDSTATFGVRKSGVSLKRSADFPGISYHEFSPTLTETEDGRWLLSWEPGTYNVGELV